MQKKLRPGRPELPKNLRKTPRNLKLPEWLWNWLDEQPNTNRALIIERAVVEKFGLKPPVD